MSFLADNSPGLRGVLSLFELHTTFYGQHDGDAVTFRLQDRDGAQFAMLVLTPTESRRWLE